MGKRMKQPEWARKLQVGDVVKKGQTYRVLRYVSRYPNGDLRGVAFAIKRCSWTGRALTFYNHVDFFLNGYQPTRIRSKLSSEMDAMLAHDSMYENRFNQKLNCCSVHGVS